MECGKSDMEFVLTLEKSKIYSFIIGIIIIFLFSIVGLILSAFNIKISQSYIEIIVTLIPFTLTIGGMTLYGDIKRNNFMRDNEKCDG